MIMKYSFRNPRIYFHNEQKLQTGVAIFSFSQLCYKQNGNLIKHLKLTV